MKTEPSLNKIIATIKRWKAESTNPRNDGWVQEGYKKMIKRVFNESGKLLSK